jgi:hypothetical protein
MKDILKNKNINKNKMCMLINCPKCHKYSFQGCGQHLNTIFANKQLDELCQCNPIVKNYINYHYK